MYLLLIIACMNFQLYLIFHPPTATITIIPKAEEMTLTGTLQLGRVVSPITLSQSATGPATGKGHQDAKQATGTITFYNGQLSPQTVPAGTILTGTDGVQIITDQDATIPAADPTANPPVFGQVTVSAHVVNSGVRGTIPAYDISQPCCLASVIAKNTQAFHGGQDERDYQTVTQADIDVAAASLKTTLSESMQGALEGQLKNGEALVTPLCSTAVTADHRPGEEATQVKVITSKTCSAVAYNKDALRAQVTQLLTTQARNKLGSRYSLLGTVQVTVTQASVPSKTKIVVLSFSCVGTWVYTLNLTAQEHLKHLIAGKQKWQAVSILSHVPGIQAVRIAGVDDNERLPKNPDLVIFQTFAQGE